MIVNWGFFEGEKDGRKARLIPQYSILERLIGWEWKGDRDIPIVIPYKIFHDMTVNFPDSKQLPWPYHYDYIKHGDGLDPYDWDLKIYRDDWDQVAGKLPLEEC